MRLFFVSLPVCSMTPATRPQSPNRNHGSWHRSTAVARSSGRHCSIHLRKARNAIFSSPSRVSTSASREVSCSTPWVDLRVPIMIVRMLVYREAEEGGRGYEASLTIIIEELRVPIAPVQKLFRRVAQERHHTGYVRAPAGPSTR
jgi:hypothetical protein